MVYILFFLLSFLASCLCLFLSLAVLLLVRLLLVELRHVEGLVDHLGDRPDLGAKLSLDFVEGEPEKKRSVK